MFRKTKGAGSAEERSDALARAMSDWGDAVYRLALGQTRSRADAEDVYQDVFLRLYNRVEPFESNEHLKAWLLRVTINRCRDLSRSGWKRRTVELDPERDAPPVSMDGAREGEDAAVWEAVGALPDNLRAAVNLHYVEGYSTGEIARILDSQPATVRTWLHRARARMKELLPETPADTKATCKHPDTLARMNPSPSMTDGNACGDSGARGNAKRPSAGAPPNALSIVPETSSR